MKAILHTAYGPPDELQLAEVARPVPNENEVLIRVRASTVTSSDCNIRDFTFVPPSFKPMARLMFGSKKPKYPILGIEFAGEVEAFGAKVRRFAVGDRVFGTSEPAFGGHAEYLCIREDRPMERLPAGARWEEAACLTLAGGTALFYIRDLAKVRPGQSVLIIGASGGIGTFAVQLAKYYGATVTGVCSGANFDLVRSLGADAVIDYTREDYLAAGIQYDVVFDVVGAVTFNRCAAIVKPTGVYMGAVMGMGELIRSLWNKRIRGGTAFANTAALSFLRGLMESGKLRPVIDREYALEDTKEAFRYVEKGHKKGNVVIKVA